MPRAPEGLIATVELPGNGIPVGSPAQKDGLAEEPFQLDLHVRVRVYLISWIRCFSYDPRKHFTSITPIWINRVRRGCHGYEAASPRPIPVVRAARILHTTEKQDASSHQRVAQQGGARAPV
jgi:hypothetical protein